MDLYTLIAGGIIRHVLSAIFVTLAARGYYSDKESSEIVAGLTGAVVMGGWSVWQKLRTDAHVYEAIQACENRILSTIRGKMSLVLLPLVLLGGLTVTGCANPRHVAVTVDVGLYHVLSDAHQLEQTALCGQPSCAGVLTAPTVPGWTDAKSRAFNQTLLPAVDAGRQFNALLASWKPGDPMPAQIQTLIAWLATSLLAITADFPDGTTKTQILADIGTAQATILNAFRLYLTVKG